MRWVAPPQAAFSKESSISQEPDPLGMLGMHIGPLLEGLGTPFLSLNPQRSWA